MLYAEGSKLLYSSLLSVLDLLDRSLPEVLPLYLRGEGAGGQVTPVQYCRESSKLSGLGLEVR